MAQNEPQKMETAGAGSEQGRTQAAPTESSGTTPTEPTTQGSGTTGRVSRREGWDDSVSTFFGGSPFALFRRLSDDMDRLFFGGGQGLGSFGGPGVRFVPTVDVEERDDKIIVRADLPGLSSDDFRVDIEDDALVLQGERRIVREDTRGGIRRSERSHGSFRRVIPLPQGASPEAADARFENGVLEIDIPRQQQSRSRRLEVRSGSGDTPAKTSSGTSAPDTTKH